MMTKYKNVYLCLVSILMCGRLYAQASGTAPFAFVNKAAATADPFSWSGTAGDGNWSTAGNWHGGVVPGTSDIAIFDSTCTSCNATIDAHIDVKGVHLKAAYTGTITQASTKTITIGDGDWTQEAGTFNGGNAAINITGGNFVLSGGSFTATSATMTLTTTTSRSLTFGASATFTHNSGTMAFAGTTGCGPFTYTLALGKTLELYHFTQNMHDACLPHTVAVSSGQVLAVYGTLTQTEGALNGAYDLYGNLVVGASALGGTGTIRFAAAGSQTYASSGGSTAGLAVTNASSTVTPAGGTTGLSAGSLTLTAGAFTAPTGTLTLDATRYGADTTLLSVASGTSFTHNSGSITLLGSNPCATRTYSIAAAQDLDLWSLTENFTGACGASILAVTGGHELRINGNFTQTSGAVGSTINLYGNLVVASTAGGGTGTIAFVGGVAQTYAYTSPGTTAALTVNHASSVVSPAGGTTDMASGAFTLTSGSFTAPSGTYTIDTARYGNATLFTVASGTSFTHNSGVLALSGYIPCAAYTYAASLAQAVDLYGLTLNMTSACGASTFNVPSGQTLNINSTFTQTSGHLNGGVNVLGNVVQTASTGDATLTFTGTANQTWTRASATMGSTGDVTINKASGTVTLGSDVNLNDGSQDLTLTGSSGGTLNLAGYALTVAGNFSIGSGTTLTVNSGSYSPSSGGRFTNNGTIN